MTTPIIRAVNLIPGSRFMTLGTRAESYPVTVTYTEVDHARHAVTVHGVRDGGAEYVGKFYTRQCLEVAPRPQLPDPPPAAAAPPTLF